MEIIETKTPTARKDYPCQFCGGLIKAGEKYQCQTNKYCGEIYNFKTHLHCTFLASHYDMYDVCGDGVTEEGFQEVIGEVFHQLTAAELAKMLYDKVKS